jgi:fatty-acyl-CoA synthase
MTNVSEGAEMVKAIGDRSAQPHAARRMHWNNQLERNAEMLGDNPALRFEGTTITWSQLRDRVRALADALSRRGVGFGDRVAVIMGNRPEILETLLAANRLGAVGVPVNFRYTGAEAAYLLQDSAAKVVMADAIGEPIIRDALTRMEARPAVIDTTGALPGSEPYEGILAEPGASRPPVDVPEDSPALIMYTSGTTGNPKGAVLSHQNLQYMALTTLHRFRLDGPEEVNLVAPPLFHIGALASVLPMILIGATSVIMPSRPFSPTEMLDLMESEAATFVFLVPTMWQAICAEPGIGRRDLSALRTTVWGAAPATVTLLKRMAEKFPGARNIAVFGQTEMTAVTCALGGGEAIRKIGSVGKPVAGVTARVVDLEMNDVGPGEVGEIVYRGPGMMLGYWNKADATAEAFRGGWFHSGDLVRADDEGYLYVVDRVKDMIISGGENIYCAEVEDALAAHPAIAEVSVVGQPHDQWGETPVAYVVLSEPDGVLDIAELRQWAAGSLARYKLPTQLEIVMTLPRNASGKVLKHVLRGQAARLHSQ